MSTRVAYFFWDENSRRLCGYSIISQENWDQQQAYLYSSRPDRKLTMVAIIDASFLDALKLNGPQNYTMDDQGVPQLLPAPQRNLTPQFIVVTDDQAMTLADKMDQMIALNQQILAAMNAMVKVTA